MGLLWCGNGKAVLVSVPAAQIMDFTARLTFTLRHSDTQSILSRGRRDKDVGGMHVDV